MQADPQPQVAIVIPCYNHGRYLAEALASARAQRYPKIDVVVVDDGSTDADTAAVLERVEGVGVRVVRQENRGLPAARNAGVRATTAPFFVPLDADDKLAPDFVSRLLPALLDDPRLGYCYSHVQLFGAETGHWACPPYDPRRLLFENLSVATAIVRREAFDAVGGYCEDMRHGCEDWDFWLALLAAGYFGRCVPDLLFHYRKHASGSMLTAARRREGELVRRLIAHHRALFASSLGVPLVDAATPADEAGFDEQLFEMLGAKAELHALENSRLWRLACGLGLEPRPRSTGALSAGPADPRERLAQLRASGTYRLIQTLKRTPLYRWYGRRKHGPDFDRPRVGAGS